MKKLKLISNLTGDVEGVADVHGDGSVTWIEGDLRELNHMLMVANPGDPGYVDEFLAYANTRTAVHAVVEDE